MVEVMPATRGITVSYEAIQQSGLKYSRNTANELRRRALRLLAGCPSPETARRSSGQVSAAEAVEGPRTYIARHRDGQVQELCRRQKRDHARC